MTKVTVKMINNKKINNNLIVIANPPETPTQNLYKIRVNDTVYSIPIDLMVPKRLNAINTLESTVPKERVYLYCDANGKDAKVSIKEMLSSFVRTDDKIPDDMQVGEYLFLEKKEG